MRGLRRGTSGLVSTIALLLVAVTVQTATARRVLLVGNELLRDTNATWMLRSLLHSANEWGADGENNGDTPPSLVVYDHYHDGYALGPNPFAADFNASLYEQLDAIASDDQPSTPVAPANQDMLQATKPTALAHAFCPGTLRLFDRVATPLQWDVVVLQDHTAAALIPWMDAHSTRPGLAILTRKILEHSPQARVLLLEGWMRDAVQRDFSVTKLEARLAERAAAETDPDRRAKLESPSPPGGAPSFLGGSHGLNAEAVLQIIEGFYKRMRDSAVADASAAAGADPVRLTAANFAVVPLGDTWRRIVASKSLSAETAHPEWISLYRSAPSESTPVAEADAFASGQAAMPSALGGFAIAAALFTSITRIRDSSSSRGYCPCTMTPPAPVLGIDEIESPAALAARLTLTGPQCAMVRQAATAAFAARYHDDELTSLPENSWIRVDDRVQLCNESVTPFDDSSSSAGDGADTSSTGAAPAGGSEGEGEGGGDVEPPQDPGNTVPPIPNPPRDPDPPPINVEAESDGSAPPPPLGPFIAGVVVLMALAAAGLFVFWYRSTHTRWQLLGSHDEQIEEL